MDTLMGLYKCGLTLEINPHKQVYMTVDQYLDGTYGYEDIDPLVRGKMVASDTIILFQGYPRTPVGFVSIDHWDLGAVMEGALDAVSPV